MGREGDLPDLVLTGNMANPRINKTEVKSNFMENLTQSFYSGVRLFLIESKKAGEHFVVG
ncbi:MAG: hypothetical protein ACTHLA_08115 [Asticcacaulis sp.]|uniref:hypothetical protein n=1 Tax=Asticcacaulis sp. TaxID=1872648 RepID=UPI003F7C4EBD